MFSFTQIKQLIILIIVVVTVIGISLFLHSRQSGRWVCKDNIWVAEGSPSGAKPGLYCK